MARGPGAVAAAPSGVDASAVIARSGQLEIVEEVLDPGEAGAELVETRSLPGGQSLRLLVMSDAFPPATHQGAPPDTEVVDESCVVAALVLCRNDPQRLERIEQQVQVVVDAANGIRRVLGVHGGPYTSGLAIPRMDRALWKVR